MCLECTGAVCVSLRSYLRGGHRLAQLSSEPAEGSLGTGGMNIHFPGRRKQQLDNLEDRERQDIGG